MWDPVQYQRYSEERSRPFFDLLARVGATAPAYVLDLGCGPGDLTVALADRWPDADVEGVDHSAQMLAAARAALAEHRDKQRSRDRHAGQDPRSGQDRWAMPDPRSGQDPRSGRDRWPEPRAGPEPRTGPEPGGTGMGSLSFRDGDVREFAPARPADVIVCNAVLQWIPDHRELLPRWAGTLSADGWLAIQVPGNYDQPSHQILRELAGSVRWRGPLAGVEVTRQTADPTDYLDLLARAGCQVDAWETTYLHVLGGADPVLEWYKGSGLRPVIAALTPAEAADFMATYAARLRTAYPAHSYGTVLPFRRVFAVARKARKS